MNEWRSIGSLVCSGHAFESCQRLDQRVLLAPRPHPRRTGAFGSDFEY